MPSAWSSPETMDFNSNRTRLYTPVASSTVKAQVITANAQAAILESRQMDPSAGAREATSLDPSRLRNDVTRHGLISPHEVSSSTYESLHLGSNSEPFNESISGQFGFSTQQSLRGGPGDRNQAESTERDSNFPSPYQPQEIQVFNNPDLNTCLAHLGDCYCNKCHFKFDDSFSATVKRGTQDFAVSTADHRYPTSVVRDTSGIEQSELFSAQVSSELIIPPFRQSSQVHGIQYPQYGTSSGAAVASQQLQAGQFHPYYTPEATGNSGGQFLHSVSNSGGPNSFEYTVTSPYSSVPPQLTTNSAPTWATTQPNAGLNVPRVQLPRNYRTPLASKTMTNQMNVKSRKRPYHKSAKLNAGQSPQVRELGDPKVPGCEQFVKAQKLLDMLLGPSTKLSESEQKNVSELVGIPVEQLLTFIEARVTLHPIVEQLASAASNCNTPPEFVAAWFLAQPVKSSRDVKDSAYQSNIPVPPEETRTAKRQKKDSGENAQLRLYQCTKIRPNGSFCLQSSKDYGDWKRHEDKHWPPQQWVCLIQGVGQGALCYVCHGPIDLHGHLPTTSHEACIARDARTDHDFLRRDKLVKHVKEVHKCDALIETWFQRLMADWKRQCGFCGKLFSDTEWDARCRHVGSHFQKGKRMDPDWKDPWPQGPEDSNPKPDDDNNDNDDQSGDGAAHGDNPDHDNFPEAEDQEGDDQDGGGDNANQSYGGRDEHEHSDDMSSEDSSIQSEDGSSQKPVPGDQQGSFERNNQVSSYFSADTGSRIPLSNVPASERPGLAFTFVRELGKGAFGVVEEIIDPQSSLHFARKSIRTNLGDSSNILAQARKEVLALRKLKNEHIVRVMASYSTPEHFSIIMSPIADCNLSDFMRAPAPSPAKQRSHLSKWFGCLASALSYMHEKDWLHVDLKPQNILVSGDRVLLSDFGSACLVPYNFSDNTPGVGCAITPMYCAPELVGKDASKVATWASDIFSLGCIYLEMATVICRESITTFEDFRSFGKGDKSFHLNTLKSSLWIERLWGIQDGFLRKFRQEDLKAIRAMLSLDAGKRPSAHSLERLYGEDECGKTGHREKDELYVVKANNKTFDAMAVASAWLGSCVKQHIHCSNLATNYFPNRILYVGKEGDEIRLQLRRHEFANPYVALSHCWGKGNILRTTRATIADRFLGIKSSSLSDDFQKAVRITRALGFNYLWIDSLCIVQDSAEDWAEESSQMHKIYSNSYLTICILNEEQLPPPQFHESRTKRLMNGQPTVAKPACGHESNAFKPLLEDNASTMLLDSPLSRRGWALQERVLSPRVLHYSTTRLAWECNYGTRTFDTTSSMRTSISKVKRFLTSFLPAGKLYSVQTTRSQCPIKFRPLWRDIVREYSKRLLTMSSDKLPALAGLAATLSAADDCQYLAGLWKDDLKYGLLWCRDLSTPAQNRPEYRAPSWSWAAIDSPVVWSKSIFDLREEPQTEILDARVTLASLISPFGAISDGFLQLRAPMRIARVVYPYVEELLELNSRRQLAFAQWDALERPGYTKYQNRLRGSRQHLRQPTVERVWCVQMRQGVGLMLRPKRRVEWKERDMDEEIEAPREFERVGMYWIHSDRCREDVRGGEWQLNTVTIV